VAAVQEVFPLCCIHFEDWTGTDAVHLLARYRDNVCCFNDDVQGTASIVLAGLINALRVKKTKLTDEKVLFLGAGSAGIGIANLIVSAMVREGLSEKDAYARVSLFDIHGLIEPSRKDLVDFQKPYAHPHKPSKDFVEAIDSIKPTAIIGVSTVGKAFTRPVIEAMAKHNKRPIIFALSNPTEHAECTPEEAYGWSQGRAIYAAGIQFPPVRIDGRTLLPSQANNVYIFPAVGMAIYATQAKRVTDEMFVVAAEAVADRVAADQLEQGMLYPPQSNMLETELYTAAKVAKVIFDRDLARVERPHDIAAFIRKHAYQPKYPDLLR
jgi:malate dehydrogenase (oxaloacetate-decarboxylating)(NADP+)